MREIRRVQERKRSEDDTASFQEQDANGIRLMQPSENLEVVDQLWPVYTALCGVGQCDKNWLLEEQNVHDRSSTEEVPREIVVLSSKLIPS